MFCRLYMKFTMETLIATVFGQWVDIQTGREGGSELMSATNEFISAFLDSMKNRTEEVTVILCKSLSKLTRHYMTIYM